MQVLVAKEADRGNQANLCSRIARLCHVIPALPMQVAVSLHITDLSGCVFVCSRISSGPGFKLPADLRTRLFRAALKTSVREASSVLPGRNH